MRELELKAVVADRDALVRHIEALGAQLVFAGSLEDRRYDTADRALSQRDHVLRLRVYRDAGGERAHLDWKGATEVHEGYKSREELSTPLGDPAAAALVLDRLGYRVSMAIDREIRQYALAGATVRLERYPHMDDLVEVEGDPRAIEAAIAALGIARDAFTTERLADFVGRFEARTGRPARIAHGEAMRDFDPADA